MYAEERQEVLAAQIARDGRVSVSQAAEQFGVTTETIRRDLAALEERGLVRRVHGGAVPATARTTVEVAVAERDQAAGPQKDRIADAALALVPHDGGSIVLDAGTTTSRLAAKLPIDAPLTVITNAVPVAAQVVALPGAELILLGGRVRARTGAAVGRAAESALGDLRADVAFLGTNGISLEHGLTTPDPDEAAVKAAMVAAGRRVVVLADSSKLHLESLVRFAGLDQVDALVTDAGIDAETRRALEAAGVEVVVA